MNVFGTFLGDPFGPSTVDLDRRLRRLEIIAFLQAKHPGNPKLQECLAALEAEILAASEQSS